MFLKNYTSDVAPHITINRIEQVLIRCGVMGITKQYVGTNGEIAAITFQLETPRGSTAVRLPADKARALDALWADYTEGCTLTEKGDTVDWPRSKKKRKLDFAEQAERTAWKLVQDWVEVQMSMIQMKQADTLQVFMAYVYDGRRTYYEALRESGFKGLLPEKCE